MSKEMTLEDLANSISNDSSTADVFTPPTMRELNMDDLEANRREIHGEEVAAREEAEKVVDTEIMANALKGMNTTIDEKIEQIEAAKAEAEAELEEDALDAELREIDDSLAEDDEADNKALEVEEDFEDEEMEEDFEDEIENKPEVKEKAVAADINSASVTNINDVVKKKKFKNKDDAAIDQMLKDLEDEEDLADDDDFDVDESESLEEMRARFRKSITSIVPVKNPVDFTGFKIRKKPISSLNCLKDVETKKRKFDWPLLSTGRNITLEESDGAELDVLNKSVNNRNNTNAIIDSIKFIYEHVVDANKPEFGTWTQTICSNDLESLYFALFGACYSDSCFIVKEHNQEDGCKKASLIKYDNIMDLVKFDDEETEEKFHELRRKDSTSSTRIQTKMHQISDDYVISYRPSTLYSFYIQNSSVSQKLYEKYPEILAMLSFIDEIYKIDRESRELVPIESKEYPNNINKTVMSKVKTLLTILKTLTPDQYSMLSGVLTNANGENKIHYVAPKCECPECHKEIPENSISALQTLFTRAQLAQIKNS